MPATKPATNDKPQRQRRESRRKREAKANENAEDRVRKEKKERAKERRRRRDEDEEDALVVEREGESPEFRKLRGAPFFSIFDVSISLLTVWPTTLGTG